MKKPMMWAVCVLMICLLTFVPSLADGLTLSGCAYVDENGNAVCDPGEALMAGVPLRLTGPMEAELVTDAYGQYAFQGLPAGVYRLVCPLNHDTLYASSLGGAACWSDGTLCLEGLELTQDARADIGLSSAARLGVQAYADANANGTRDKRERELPGVVVELMDGDGKSVMARGVTDASGAVTFSAAPGRHVLRVTLPDGYAFSASGAENCVTGPDASALSEVFSLRAGEESTLCVAARPAGFFSGRAFEDMNNNGIMDEGEPGVSGVTVRLSGSRSGTERSLLTDESGEYRFDRLPDDKYTVTAELPEGMLFARYSKTGGDLRSIFSGAVFSREFSVKSTAPVSNKNIGAVQKGAITGRAFLDLNYNGLPDEGEPGFKGVTVEAIKLSNNDSMGKCMTGEDGSFRLENLRGGDYRLRAILPDDGAIFTIVAEGAPDSVNRFEQRTGRRENSVQPLSIISGGEASALIGVARGASVQGTVFQDEDYNGRRNGKEKALSGHKVQAVDANGQVVATDTTNAKGHYTLTGIMPGEYTIQVQRKAGFGFTRLRPDEKDGSFVAALEGEWGVTVPLSIAMGEQLTGVNAGMLPASTVSGFFFHDLNDNGLWEPDEPGMTQARVRLTSEDGEIDLFRTPAENGAYFFDGVMPGQYTLTYLLPEHCEMAHTAQQGNTVAHAGSETVTAPFKITMAEKAQLPLAGAVMLGSLEGLVFHDGNADGLQGEGEAALAGASITLAQASGEAAQVTTDESGAFSLLNLRPGRYTLEMNLPEGFIFSHDTDSLSLQPVSAQSIECPWDVLVSRRVQAIGAVKPASIEGEIWMDENQNGVQGEDEWIMTDIRLSLLDEAGQEVASALSDESGYCFPSVRPGTYTVCFPLPEQSSPADAASAFLLNGTMMQTAQAIAPQEGETVSGISTGLVSQTSIGGTAWLHENGRRNPVSGVTVTLYQNGQPFQTAKTGEDGSYRFDGLWPAEYTVGASLPQEMIYVRPDDLGYPAGATVIADPQQGLSEPFELSMAQHRLDRNILYIKPGKVGDIAWLDENANGLVDGAERRLSGVRIALVKNGEIAYETTTDTSGYYLFSHVYPGEYTLQSQAWPELTPTQSVQALRIISSCLVQGDGTLAQSESFRLESGETNLNLDVGYLLLEGMELPAEAQATPPAKDWTLCQPSF